MESKNMFKMVGYVVNPKSVSPKMTTFALNFGSNQGTKEEPVWKNVLVNMNGVGEAVGVEAGAQIEVEGFFTVNAYTPKTGGDEVTKLQYTCNKMSVLKKPTK